MNQAAAGRHPLNATGFNHAFVAAAVLVQDVAFENKRHGFEAPVRVRAEGQAAVVGPVHLRAVVVEKQKRVDVLNRVRGQGPVGDEVGNGRAHGAVLLLDGTHG